MLICWVVSAVGHDKDILSGSVGCTSPPGSVLYDRINVSGSLFGLHRQVDGK